MIGWFVLLAILFAATNVNAVNEGFGTSIAVFTSAAMDKGWAEAIILIACVGQFFCGMACVTSSSRTFYAFSRDRAIPGWNSIWSRVSAKGVPSNAVVISCLLALMIVLPAFFAWTSSCPRSPSSRSPRSARSGSTSPRDAGLSALARRRLIPAALLEPRAKYKWVNPMAVIFVVLIPIVLCLPFSSLGVPWKSDFDWSFFNYTPLVVSMVLIGTRLAWVLGANKTYKGPVKTIEEDVAPGTDPHIAATNTAAASRTARPPTPNGS